jgi:hypothetical protein
MDLQTIEFASDDSLDPSNNSHVAVYVWSPCMHYMHTHSHTIISAFIGLCYSARLRIWTVALRAKLPGPHSCCVCRDERKLCNISCDSNRYPSLSPRTKWPSDTPTKPQERATAFTILGVDDLLVGAGTAPISARASGRHCTACVVPLREPDAADAALFASKPAKPSR